MLERSSFTCSFKPCVVVLAILLCAFVASAQTSSFTYQGRLTDGGTSANGNYDLQFALFDSLSGGAQVGSTLALNTVAVSNGVFTVSLDFGASAFTGPVRFLEISARPSTGGSFTLLSPRQQITSTPYAVRSLIASSADSVPASGVAAGSGNYIQNSANPQASSNFNISGNGTAGGTLTGNIINATMQYNLNGNGILSNAGFFNLFAGTGAGAANTTGTENSFFGAFAGEKNTSGEGNTLVGDTAGRANTTGRLNSFFGGRAGDSNTKGVQNAFFGFGAGAANTEGNFEAFFGQGTGEENTTGIANAFFGTQAGLKNTTGSNNAFVGTSAGSHNTTGNLNTLIGTFSDVLSGPILVIDNATAIGAKARVDASNSLVLGSINGINSATADTRVGIGTTAPAARLHVVGSTGLIGNVGIGTTTPLRPLQIGADTDSLFTLEGTSGSPNAGYIRFGDNTGWKLHFARNREGSTPAGLNSGTTGVLMTIQDNGRVGIGTTSPDQVLSVNGNASKAGGGSWASFSDERLKNIRGRFTPGLNAVMRLQPLRYEYKRDNALSLKSEGEHVGFSAQAVQKIIPEAVTTNDKGYLLVNNDPILWTMLNAIKEQQAQIQQQRELIGQQRALAARQQQQLDALKKLACRSHRRAGVCK